MVVAARGAGDIGARAGTATRLFTIATFMSGTVTGVAATRAGYRPPGYVPPRYPSHRPPSYPGYGRPSYPSNRLPATTVNLHPAELHPQRQQRSFDQLRSAQTETRQPSLSRSFR